MFVYGNRFKRVLMDRYGFQEDRIAVIGSAKTGERFYTEMWNDAYELRGRGLRVLFCDQPLVEQRKVSSTRKAFKDLHGSGHAKILVDCQADC